VLRSAIVRRISVVGNSGSGKSTLARELAAALGVPHLELDGVFHQPGWTPLQADEFRQAVSAAVATDGWVIDGDYNAVRPLIWARADTVRWLDLPRRTVMRQVVWRTLRRGATREELWNGNRESLRNFLHLDPEKSTACTLYLASAGDQSADPLKDLRGAALDPEKSIISWAWHNHAKYHARHAAAAADPANAHLAFVRLTSRREVTRFLALSARQARR
jgi:adenylate kinase family enzyme